MKNTGENVLEEADGVAYAYRSLKICFWLPCT